MNPDGSKKILIVDDQSLILKALTLMLEPFYTIEAVLDGQQALISALSDPPPDLILLDIKMPEMDGYEVCRRLKEDQHTRDIPVIFVTAMDRKRDEVLGFKVGAVDYIAKPIVQETLLARVNIHLALQDKQTIVESRTAELEALSLLQNKFIGQTAHDLRAPIASMLEFADVLQSEQHRDSEGSGRYPGFISTACKKMLEIINDTLDSSVIESGDLVLNPDPGSLAELVTNRVSVHEPIAKQKNIEVVEQYDDVDEFWFDPGRVAQVLDKLISNAIKFSSDSTQVLVTLEEVDNLVMVSIKDQGPGLPSEDLLGMFDHVQKLSNKPTDGESSTHLGLAIARKIVDAHQGTIMVQSEPGNGATFSFALPKKNVQS
jgi:two-component system sensor histidine kinase/response regulator